MKIHPYLSSIALLLLTVFLFQGCVVWDFVEVRWQNATGYFNTYYNAERTFEQAVEEIKQRQNERAIDPNQASVAAVSLEMPDGMPEEQREQIRRDMMMEQGSVPSSAIVLLDKVIEKCSRILINYPKSKWVDNALMLIGKSYYYKKEALRAERKFQELLDRYPDSDLVPEAILWLGKSFVRLENFESAEITLNRAVESAIEEGEPDVASQAYFELGKMHLLLGDRARAVADYEEAVTFAADRDQLLEVQLALAREYERLGETEKAAKAYRDIFKLDPSTDLAFIAELNYAKLTRVSGDLDEASNTLINMLENPLYLDFDGKIQLEIAHLYYAYHERYEGIDDSLSADAFRAAIEQYTFVDTTFKGQAEAADALYAKGRIYEHDLGDYDNAYENYSKAKMAFPGVESSKLGGIKEKIFGDYRKLRNQISMKDTTLFFVLNPDSLRVRDSLQVIADSLDREQKLAEGIDESTMSEEERMAERFRRRRPHGRNTGRINPWERELEKQQQAMAAGLKNTQQAMTVSGPEYRRVDLENTNPDSLRRVIAALQMEMGWQMYDRIENVDSARWYYRKAFDGNLSDSLRPQALYTMAAIERNTGVEDEARRLEDQLIRDFPTSPYAHSIMALRGLPLPKDSAAIAQEAYAAAAAELERGSRQQGITMMKRVIEDFPDSEAALRAQLAIAMLYEENRGEEALAMYREMVEKHPDSRYSKRGREILDAIENAKKREAQEIKEAELEAERKRKADEERKRIERRYQNPLLDEELKVMRDSVRTEEEKVDPTKDEDFPLRLPGEDTPTPDGGKEAAGEDVPQRPAGRRNPDSIDPQNLPGDTLRRLTPPVPIERK
ncbi:MAG: tetratricopeptide repeat protein [Bacteroidota bacterium]|nr:tetratricopeptide repeat protein [Bacteroidota bacterium]